MTSLTDRLYTELQIGRDTYFQSLDPLSEGGESNTQLYVNVPDSFVEYLNKTGKGHGESKLYIGERNRRIEDFLKSQNYSSEDNPGSYKIKCFVLKKDLKRYLTRCADEYKNPSQNYNSKENFGNLYQERIRMLDAQDDVLYFELEDQRQLKGSRLYLNSSDPTWTRILRSLAIPRMTKFIFTKVSTACLVCKDPPGVETGGDGIVPHDDHRYYYFYYIDLNLLGDIEENQDRHQVRLSAEAEIERLKVQQKELPGESLKDIYKRFEKEDVQWEEVEQGALRQDVLWDHYTSDVADAGLIRLGVLKTVKYIHWENVSWGMRITGYGGPPEEDDGVLSLIVSEWSQGEELEVMNRAEMDRCFNMCKKFLEKSFDEEFKGQLPVAEDVGPLKLAQMISDQWSTVRKVKLILLTNKELRIKTDNLPEDEYDGKVITYTVWDFRKVSKFKSEKYNDAAGTADIDFDALGIPPLKMLPANVNNSVHDSYITIIDGESLAKIYENHKNEILQQNVRVFLQDTGKVNRGMKETLETNPKMFFSFNNGITCTASEITQRNGEIVAIKEFQIVNGGQTTASIHKVYIANGEKLPDVYVQMKLSVIREDSSLDIGDVVSNISRYSNTQNAVNLPDLSSNHPYHRFIESYNLTESIPVQDGDVSMSEYKWFYERMRGDYINKKKAEETLSKKKQFDNTYKGRRFIKTELGLVINMWEPGPDNKSNATQVNLGGTKAYRFFQERIKKQYKTDESSFDTRYYHSAIAKIIIKRRLEKLLKTEFDIKGHKNRFVSHSICKLASDLRKENKTLSFEKVWKLQDLTLGLKQYFSEIIPEIENIIFNPPQATQDRDTWAKTQKCTDKVEELEIKFPEALYDDLEDSIVTSIGTFTYTPVQNIETKVDQKSEEKPGKNLGNDRENPDIRLLEQIMEFQGKGSTANKYVSEQPHRFWRKFFDYGYKHRLLYESERRLLVKLLSNRELIFDEGTKIIHYVNELSDGFKQDLEENYDVISESE